ncbi:MAG: hypothetical protein ACI8PT_002740 [Gammaproteobacteria bacterium]|jgi:hypothetical protein
MIPTSMARLSNARRFGPWRGCLVGRPPDAMRELRVSALAYENECLPRGLRHSHRAGIPCYAAIRYAAIRYGVIRYAAI